MSAGKAVLWYVDNNFRGAIAKDRYLQRIGVPAQYIIINPATAKAKFDFGDLIPVEDVAVRFGDAVIVSNLGDWDSALAN